ncbi:hypothetical protein fugu_008791 [Takifugu bimaculatus]|uniref:ZP domain-containing protein n=1 Tax=Takifugu bimaculatus TaxID=433685 RepID=A0A4Z2AWQ7_9TELE|nr:hypothetical protein fugu_008791 [Takifugu bimaculatus]
MKILSVLFLVSMAPSSRQLTCDNNLRRPEYSDISVECGTASIGLAIQICPVVYTGYNESQLILNNVFDNWECKGTVDESVSPPVVRFTFPINATNACGSSFKTTSAPGTGIFSDFSNIQTVNISGAVRSQDPTTGIVTYNTELSYHYSCCLPFGVSDQQHPGGRDINYTLPLVIPPLGIELRSNVYVQVQAVNLTNQYHVLLDRCYASISPYPTNSTFFNLFVSCSRDPMTVMHENGDSQHARFSFAAFRFLEQENQTVSTYYLHCITRLCEISKCSEFKQCNNRKKRDVDSAGVSDATTLSSMAIVTKNDQGLMSKEEAGPSSHSEPGSRIGLGIAVGVLAVALVVGLAAGASPVQKTDSPLKSPVHKDALK